MLSRSQSSRPGYPIDSLLYRDVGPVVAPEPEAATQPALSTPADEAAIEERRSAEEMERLLAAARGEARAEAEAALQVRLEQEMEQQRRRIEAAVTRFDEERRTYFAEVERDVVELGLAIAARILHRESTIDPGLLATLVRSSLERLNSGSVVTVRVTPAEVELWNTQLRAEVSTGSVRIAGDESLQAGDCRLLTSVGSADFSLAVQLKEVEHGFADLLSRRPEIR